MKIPAPAQEAEAGAISRQLDVIPIPMSKATIKEEQENYDKKQDLTVAVLFSEKAHILTPRHVKIVVYHIQET